MISTITLKSIGLFLIVEAIASIYYSKDIRVASTIGRLIRFVIGTYMVTQ